MSGSAQDLAGTVPDTSTETSTAGKQRTAGGSPPPPHEVPRDGAAQLDGQARARPVAVDASGW